jgi:hypothetical protein
VSGSGPVVIAPTVGRIVHYRQMTPGQFPGSHDVVPAIITHVHSDRLVNLCVFDANGGTHQKTSVKLVQDGDEPEKFAHCSWMPFQKGQAAKLEAAEQKFEAAKLGDGVLLGRLIEAFLAIWPIIAPYLPKPSAAQQGYTGTVTDADGNRLLCVNGVLVSGSAAT